jgi:hypothetical protein
MQTRTSARPRKGGREDRPADKITLCHATRSVKNPYVGITISMNGLHGHGPAGDSRHHEGSWKDVIPAPPGGCPTTAQQQSSAAKQQPTTSTAQPAALANLVAAAPEVAATAPATEAPQQVVLGARASGGHRPTRAGQPAASKVLGAQASGGVPKAALASRAAGNRNGSLPFTGFNLVIVLLAGAAALLGGFALRRVTTQGR